MEEKGKKKWKLKNGNETFDSILKGTKSRNKWIFLVKCKSAMKCLDKVNKTSLDFFLLCYGFF